ncbi:MAG: heme exporter protein CcmD [Pseudohongiellaceae bacterium]|uniref:Heme exporter protein D n=1 Tax=OM182 bacterium MED-G28 TaxID=1986256 RepID=A0A2A5WD27_9GAMM|nr:heme exporter protein CcmD [Gammaproteobacteria bacterium]PDH34281.1 MAG: heme exporter protein CcmD [OM182 bacterium MED-G28]|tara:strand:+ start:82 stop:321 length:240 start_codon:yes stop_codon:yes gene_type:complete
MFESIQFSSFGDFVEMGGYAFNVWSVYALFLLFFFINLYFPILKRKQIMREQKRRLLVNREKVSIDSKLSNNEMDKNDS